MIKEILKDNRGIASMEAYFIFILLPSIVLVFGLLIYGEYLEKNVNELSYKTEELSKENIYAMSDNSSVSGSFVWGTGDIESGTVYNYMVEDDSGGFKQKTVPSKNSTIYYLENDSATPVVVKYKRDYGFIKNLLISDKQKEEYKFHVPKGTVSNTIEIDTK